MYEYIRLECNPKKGVEKPDTSLAFYSSIISEKAKRFTQLSASPLAIDEITVAVGAHHNGKPVGIAAALHNIALKTSEVRIFFVLPEYPFEEIASELLSRLLSELQQQKSTICKINIIKDDPQTPLLDKVLEKGGWKGVVPFMLRLFFDIATFDPKYLHYKMDYPENFQEILWEDLSREDRRRLRTKFAEIENFTYLSPFQDEETIVQNISLGVKDASGNFVAWFICNHIDQDNVRYTSFYADPEVRNRQLTIKLPTKCFLMTKEKTSYKTFIMEFLWNNITENRRIFIKKRLEPQAIKIEHVVQAWHTL